MLLRASRRASRSLVLALAVGALTAACDEPGSETASSSTTVSLSHAELVALGRSIYRSGRLPDGRSVEAVVAGDVRVEGTQFSCVSCHQRSGLGSVEAWLVAPPITGWALDAPRESPPRPRPGYQPGDMQDVLRRGLDPGGNELLPLMPRYDLADHEIAGLDAYLHTLSAAVSPGVTEEEIHLATVFTPGPEAEDMLALLRLFVDERNRNTRNETGRVRSGPFYRAQHNESYRRWVLHEWPLSGDPESWPEQLEQQAERTPVFALISGWVSGPWEPIHEFCSKQELPAILPNTDIPPADVDDDYTLYFSAGVDLEAGVLAARLLDEDCRRVTAVHDGSLRARAAAHALRRALDGRCSVDIVVGEPASEIGEVLRSVAATDPAPDAVVLWLDADGLAALAREDGLLASQLPLFVSTMPVDGRLEKVPEAVQRSAWLVHPFSLPRLFDSRFPRTAAWLRGRGFEIRPGAERLLAQTYFACKLFGDALMHIRFDHFYRDYFLEGVDHITTMGPWSAVHPDPTFGPGQRTMSKGCYLLPPGWDPDTDDAEWVVP